MILTCLAYSLTILGLYFAASEGGLLQFLKRPFRWAESRSDMAVINYGDQAVLWPYKVILFFSRPFIECPKCMASIWGTALYYWFNGTIFTKEYLLTVFIVSAMNHILVTLYYKLDR